VIIVPTFEAAPGELRARTRESTILLTLPGGSIGPGQHRLTLVGTGTSLQWSVLVR
jgi:hypothetical protein